MTDLNLLSEKLLRAVKMEQLHNNLTFELSVWQEDLSLSLYNDDKKLAFWINIYNSFYQIMAIEYPELEKRIYKEKRIQIGNAIFSLDDIEHGILRLGQFKYSFGFWKSIGAHRHLRNFRPTKLDFRIHFALNCGAKSCPPILHYTVAGLHQELDLASSSFLMSETTVDTFKKTVLTSRLFLWYYRDFGKKKGILKLLGFYLNQNFKGYKIKFKTYDWTTRLMMFRG